MASPLPVPDKDFFAQSSDPDEVGIQCARDNVSSGSRTTQSSVFGKLVSVSMTHEKLITDTSQEERDSLS